mgnify:FL=1
MRPLPRKIQTGHLALLVISLCYVVGYWQTLSALGVEWSGNGAYSHGFLAVLIILYMLWQNRTLISRVNGRLPIFATIIVACAGTGWMLVTMISVQKAQVLFWYISLI